MLQVQREVSHVARDRHGTQAEPWLKRNKTFSGSNHQRADILEQGNEATEIVTSPTEGFCEISEKTAYSTAT